MAGELYLEKRLSINQIASLYRVARTVIRSRLRDLGIDIDAVKPVSTNPENYRCRIPPYGFLVRDGKLLPDRMEMIICRLVVELIHRNGRTHSEVARELTQRGLKSRSGKSKWDSKTIFNIFKRWKDKL